MTDEIVMTALEVIDGKIVFRVKISGTEEDVVQWDGKHHHKGSWYYALAEKGDLEQSWVKAAKSIEIGERTFDGTSTVAIDIKTLVNMANKAAHAVSSKAQDGPITVTFRGNRVFTSKKKVK